MDGNIYFDENHAVAAIDYVNSESLDKNSIVTGRQAVANNGKFNFTSLILRLHPDSKA